MAEHLGRHLRDEKFTRIYSSDLKRCCDTTHIILQHSKNHHEEVLILDKTLRERVNMQTCTFIELMNFEVLKTGTFYMFLVFWRPGTPTA